MYVYVIARVGVKFGINFTSVRLSDNTMARDEAEYYLQLYLNAREIYSGIFMTNRAIKA